MSIVFFGISTRTYHYDRAIGRLEFAGPGFRCPMDLALGLDGRMYVLNRGLEYKPDGVRVTMLTINEEYLGQFSKFGDGNGDLFWPSSIAVDSNQNVYISDEWLNRISIFDKDGEFLDKWGVPGSREGEIHRPSGIRFDKEDNLYIVDSYNNRVQMFTKNGKFLSKWGEAGSGEGQFNLPWGLTIEGKGDVYVADWRNDRIQKFAPDGRYLAEIGSSGSGVAEFNRPTGVGVDKDGDIYVADWGNNRVQAFTPDGKYITTLTGEAGISKWGEQKLASNPNMIRQRNMVRDQRPERLLARPNAIATDDQDRIIIVDSDRARLQVYRKVSH